jgi:hypothetical protein
LVFNANQTPLAANEIQLTARNANGKNHLGWTVKPGNERVSYTVQASEDATAFTEIVKLNAKMESGGARYDYSDNRELDGKRYYRIMATTRDGKHLYSNVASVSNLQGNDLSLEVYPNPVVNSLNLSFGSQAISGTVKIFTSEGQLVQEEHFTGKSGLAINTQQLAKGIYLIELSATGGNRITRKFVK